MTRILYASLLLPFGLLVWREGWTSVAALALWVVLALALIAYSLLSEWIDVAEARKTEARLMARLASLGEVIAATDGRITKTEQHLDNLLQARGQAQRKPTL